MAWALNENLDFSLTFLRNCSLVGNGAAGLYAQAETTPKPWSGEMELAPSSGNPTCPFLADPDSSEMAKTDLWCPANDVHLWDLSKEIAEISSLLSHGISEFWFFSNKGISGMHREGEHPFRFSPFLLLCTPERKRVVWSCATSKMIRKTFFFLLPNLRLWVLWKVGLLKESTSFPYSLHLQLL